MRGLYYAYPSSGLAAKHGRSDRGCYVLTLAHHEYPIDCPRAAVLRFEGFPHLSINQDSFFGPLDTDTGRRERMMEQKEAELC